MSYPAGSTEVVWGKFYDSLDNDKPIDPLNLRLVVEHEDILTVYGAEVVRVRKGVFYCLVTLSDPGPWHYKWKGDGLSTPDFLMTADRSRIDELELAP